MSAASDIAPARLALGALPLVAGVVIATLTAGAAAGALTAIFAAALAGLALQRSGRTALAVGGALLPAAIVLDFGLRDGGYYLNTVGVTGCVAALVLAALVALGDRPFGGRDRLVTGAAVCLVLLALWSLASMAWSDAPGRAIVESARAGSYALLLLLGLGLAAAGADRTRAFAGVTAALWVVTAVALGDRLLPDVFGQAGEALTERIAEPVGYTNGLGAVAAVTAALLLHWTSAATGRLGRLVPVVALVVPVATLSLTFSRGALIVVAVAVTLYPLVARSWHVIPGFLVGCATAVAAWLLVYGASDVANATVAGEPYLDAARGLLGSLVLAGVIGAAVRALAFGLDERLRRRTARAPRVARVAVVATYGLVLVAGGVVLASSLEERTRQEQAVLERADVRERLTQATTTGRLEIWTALRRGFEERPLLGTGAGTSAILFDRYRTTPRAVAEGHSLYGEALAELGPLGLLGAAGGVLLLLAAAARRAGAGAAAGLCAAGAGWAVHAGVDWDWELAAVSAWFFLGAGLVLARPALAGDVPWRSLPRILTVAGLTAVACAFALVTANDRHVTEVQDAFARGDCEGARADARRATRVLDARPEVHHVLAYCAARDGDWARARREIDRTRALDPRNAGYAYSEALIAAASGGDVRGPAREALARRPIDEQARWLLGDGARHAGARRRAARQQLRNARDIR